MSKSYKFAYVVWRVYSYLIQKLKDKETIDLMVSSSFRLKEGCQNLEIPKDTVICIFANFSYDLPLKLIILYDNLATQELIAIVADDSYEKTDKFISKFIGKRKIKIINYKDFVKGETREGGEAEDSTISLNQKRNVSEELKNLIGYKKVTLFLGAGVSMSEGIPSWEGLLQQLCIKRKIPKLDRDIEPIVKGRYIISNYEKNISDSKIKDFGKFYDDMRKIMYWRKERQESNLISAICDLVENCNVESIVTYNYDDLIERSLQARFEKSKNKRYCYPIYAKVKQNDSNVLPIYHVHGYVPREGKPSDIVLGEKEYHDIYREAYHWSNVEQLHALTRSVCIFIGLSMIDPNLRRLIDISNMDNNGDISHYAFLRGIEYDKVIMETTMRDMGVNCIWYNNYSDLPTKLQELLNKN